MKRTGVALVAILIIVASVALLSGVFEAFWPANQSSPVAQQLIEPGKPVNTFPITFLGDLKNQQKKVDVISATVGVVKGEYDEKVNKAQAAYDKLIGTIDKPGLLGTGAAALLAMYATALYKNGQLYNKSEVEEAVKNGKVPV